MTVRIYVDFVNGQKSFVQWRGYTGLLTYCQAEILVQTLGLADKILYHPHAYDLYYTGEYSF